MKTYATYYDFVEICYENVGKTLVYLVKQWYNYYENVGGCNEIVLPTYIIVDKPLYENVCRYEEKVCHSDD